MIIHPLVEGFYKRIWNAGDLTASLDLLVPDFSFRGSLGDEIQSVAGFAEYVQMIRGALADYRCEITECVSEADQAFVKVIFAGRHVGVLRGFPPTGKLVAWQAAALFKLAKGRIKSLWVLGDVAALEAQLRTQRETIGPVTKAFPEHAELSRDELAKEIRRRAHLRGEFTLRSGLVTSDYFDKYQLESNPVLLRQIAAALIPLVPSDVDALAGLELGGVAIATVLSQLTGLSMRLVRKQPKTYGTRRLAEGGEVAGLRVAIVEDVATTGGQIIASARELRSAGAKVEHAIVVIDRQQGSGANLQAEKLELRALISMQELQRA